MADVPQMGGFIPLKPPSVSSNLTGSQRGLRPSVFWSQRRKGAAETVAE